MPSDPEELLRSIERTREELALTVDTIAGRLDPRWAAKRGLGRVKSSVTGVVEGARLRLGRADSGPPSSAASASVARSASFEGSAAEIEPDGHRSAAGFPNSTASKAAIGAGLAALLALAAVLAARSRKR